MTMQPMMSGTLEEKDMLHTILSLLKQTTATYATAVTESSCATVKQTMQRLFNETVMEQGECFQIMQRHGWYTKPEDAPRQSIRKAITAHRQKRQEISQFIIRANSVRGGMPNYTTGAYQQQMSYQPSPTYQAYTPSDMSAGTAEWVRQQAMTTRQQTGSQHGEIMQ